MSDSPEFRNDPSDDIEEALPKPVVAVVGRPNVGKSTLVNRILGRRAAVVQDVPGVTRDRVSYDAEWSGRQFVLVDTGGWASDASGMAAMIAEQAELAISTADAVLFVVDANVGTTDEDEAVVQVLRQSRKPVVVAANKVDNARGESEAATMWNLGLGSPTPFPPCTDAVQVTFLMHSLRYCRRSRLATSHRTDRVGSPLWASRMSASRLF